MIGQRMMMKARSMHGIDGIMMLGWYVDTGLTGASASSSFRIESEVIFPNSSHYPSELDFLGNYNGSAGNTLLFGANYGKAYVFAFGSNRAPSIEIPYVTPMTYDVTVDYSGIVDVDIDGTQSSTTVSVNNFPSSSDKFLIGNGGPSGGGYRPAPVVIKRVTFTLDGVVAAEYMPAISGGKLGLQDMIRGTFTSAPSGGVTLAYIESMQ